MIRPAPTPAGISLRAALATVHRDRSWWTKCLLHGALALSGLGLPITAGFIVESYDNSRRGFPTPLPPWADWTTRGLAGIFALLIDFAFFVLPILVSGLFLGCVSISLFFAGITAESTVNVALTTVASICGGFLLAMFLSGVSPIGRLIFVREGRIEEAISMTPLRLALSPQGRPIFLRARLFSLAAYIPALLLGAVTILLALPVFPGQLVAITLGVWLTLSALVYANLLITQLYVAAEKELQRRTLGM